MKFSKYEQYIKLFEGTENELTKELKKQLRRFDDADKRYAKKMKNINIVEYRDGETEADVNYYAHESEVERRFIINFLADHLDGALAILSDNQRKVVQSYFYDNLDQKKIAEKEQLHKAMVSYLLKSALQKMLNHINSEIPG